METSGKVIIVSFDHDADPRRDFDHDSEIIAMVTNGALIPVELWAIGEQGELVDSLGGCYVEPQNVVEECREIAAEHEFPDWPIVVNLF